MPLSLVAVSRVNPVSALVMVTLAPDTSAELESETVPVIWPVAVCACEGLATQ